MTACNDDLPSPTFTVGDAVNAITLRAGISDAAAGVMTKAGAEDHHTTPGHVNFTNGTQLRLRVDGTWLEKTSYTLPHGNVSSGAATQETTATTGDKTGTGMLHNEVNFTPAQRLYWDDYGTADPVNIDAPKGTAIAGTGGRNIGLTIYGVTLNGKDAAPIIDGSTGKSWDNLNWTVSQDQSATGVWGSEDLLISNNIKAGNDGTYKFDDYVYDLKNSTNTASNIIEFTHAMSKITINLIAGEGFPTTGVGATAKKFGAEPEVVLTSNLYGETSKTEWANTQYAVNVITGAVATASNTPKAITTKTTKTNDATFTVVKEALIMPGSTFGDAAAGVYPQVLSILADGNRYYVTTEMIRAAITTAISAGTHANSYTTQPGKNYVFKVIINKTSIDVTATIKNWEDVTAADETPIINFSNCYGQEGTDLAKGFSFYRSTSVNGSYINGLTEGNTSTVSYASSTYTMSPQLYWPDHSTHYFFRGVWPTVNTTDGPATSNVKANAVEITNVAYAQGKYPSDLMIGMPRKTDGTPDEHCKSSHDVDGICATDALSGSSHENEGLIHMNFQYAMSQVEVELQSATGSASVNINENTVVELVNVYNNGEVKLSDESISTSGDKGNYTLDLVTGTGNELKRHSAIVPQTLTFSTAGASTNLRFKITVTNDDAVLYADETEYNAAKGTSLDAAAFAALSVAERTKTPATTDVYYTDVEPIKKTGSTDKVAPNGKWESGVHYKYVLTLSKTAINVTATLKDWIEVTASDNIWF